MANKEKIDAYFYQKVWGEVFDELTSNNMPADNAARMATEAANKAWEGTGESPRPSDGEVVVKVDDLRAVFEVHEKIAGVGVSCRSFDFSGWPDAIKFCFDRRDGIGRVRKAAGL
jgi:hypothetical protein